MTSLESRCLDSFPAWLRALGDDARALAALLESASGESSRRWAAVALTYLFKSVDLIPDGLEDLGYIDDAFVARVAAANVGEEERAADPSGTWSRLAEEAWLIREFLDTDAPALVGYVARLESSTVRGRSVADVLENPALAEELAREVRQWADEYTAPGFARDAKNLVKLRAFLRTRLAGTARAES